MIKKYSDLKRYNQPALAFFLPTSTRPTNLPPVSDKLKNFWHTGIIWDGDVYECFNNNKHMVSPEHLRVPELQKLGAKFVKTNIDSNRLKQELTSGTSCDEYVLRATGHSKLTGDNKGTKYPEDVMRILKQG